MEESPRDKLVKFLMNAPASDPVKRHLIRGLARAVSGSTELFREQVPRGELEDNPHRAWSAYLDLLGFSGYDDLTPVQRVAFLAWHYDAEVHNGGHMQYFLNSSGKHAEQAVAALPLLGAHQQGRVLSEAVALVRANPLPKEHGSEIYRTSPLKDPLRKLDREYHHAEPTITELLKQYLQAHFDEFIEVIEDGAG